MNPEQPSRYPALPSQRHLPYQPYQGHSAPAPHTYKWLVPSLTAAAGLVVGGIITAAASPSASHAAATPTVTVTAAPGVAGRTAAPPAALAPGTTMGADGTAGIYVVGQDIKAGTWHTTGAVGGTSGNCYVALLSSTNSNDIIDNDNVTGPDTITITPSVKAVQVNGCETWHRE